MQCLRCDGNLETERYEGISIDTCPRCGGQWLDAGELKSIVDIREERFSEEEKSGLKLLQREFHPDSMKSEDTLQCPMGHGDMTKFRYGGTSPVVVDRCPECEGMWLDDGELEQVQILVESWEKELASDLEQWGPRLDEIRAVKERQYSAPGQLFGNRPRRYSLVHALSRGILDFIT